MQEIKIYFVLACLVWLWINNMGVILLKVDGIKYPPRNKICGFIINHKPFNCGICLSFWTGIIVTILTGEILFLTLPLSFKILNKLL